MFHGKYHQNAGFNISILVDGSVRGEVSKGNWHHQSSPYILYSSCPSQTFRDASWEVYHPEASRHLKMAPTPKRWTLMEPYTFCSMSEIVWIYHSSWWFFTNPSEKYIRQINQFPNFAVETKKTWNHHVVICWISSAPTTKGSYSKPSELTVFGFMRKVRLSVHCTPQKINGFFT